MKAQQYLRDKLQPTLSDLTMELLKTKPVEPNGEILAICSAKAEEVKIEKRRVMMEGNPELNDEEKEKYYDLIDEKIKLQPKLQKFAII